MQKHLVRYLEAGLLAIGLTLLAIFLAFRVYGGLSSRAAVQRFTALNSEASAGGAFHDPTAQGGVDFGLWSEKRIAAYKESLAAGFDSPIAVLTVRRLALEVPVYDGTEELVLNRGVGRIIGTARPGEPGNIGIAGHRDGFFRCLKDIQIGDEIELAMPGRKTLYIVDSIEVVTPDDVGVLQPKAHPALTLVTCYPFYFVGNAPKRYIVRAPIGDAKLPDSGAKPGLQLNTTSKQEATK